MGSKVRELFLENQLCFPLYAASRLTTKIYAPLLKELDLTYPQYLVMLVLWEHESMSVNKISKLLYLETNTVTPLLKRLEQKKLVARVRSKEDERKVMISLTSDGEALKEQAVEIPHKIVSSFQSSEAKSEDILQFQQTLVELVKVLHNKTTEE